jgi:hypothetical protein
MLDFRACYHACYHPAYPCYHPACHHACPTPKEVGRQLPTSFLHGDRARAHPQVKR